MLTTHANICVLGNSPATLYRENLTQLLNWKKRSQLRFVQGESKLCKAYLQTESCCFQRQTFKEYERTVQEYSLHNIHMVELKRSRALYSARHKHFINEIGLSEKSNTRTHSVNQDWLVSRTSYLLTHLYIFICLSNLWTSWSTCLSLCPTCLCMTWKWKPLIQICYRPDKDKDTCENVSFEFYVTLKVI